MTGTDRNEFPPPSACAASDHLMSQLHLQSELPLQFRTGCMPHTNTPSTLLIPPWHLLLVCLGTYQRHQSRPPPSLQRLCSHFHPRIITKCGVYFKCCVASVCLFVLAARVTARLTSSASASPSSSASFSSSMLLTFSLSSNHAFGQLDSFQQFFLISLSYTLCGLPQNTQFNYEYVQKTFFIIFIHFKSRNSTADCSS